MYLISDPQMQSAEQYCGRRGILSTLHALQKNSWGQLYVSACLRGRALVCPQLSNLPAQRNQWDCEGRVQTTRPLSLPLCLKQTKERLTLCGDMMMIMMLLGHCRWRIPPHTTTKHHTVHTTPWFEGNCNLQHVHCINNLQDYCLPVIGTSFKPCEFANFREFYALTNLSNSLLACKVL